MLVCDGFYVKFLYDGFSYGLLVCGSFLCIMLVCDSFPYGLLLCDGFSYGLLVCDGFFTQIVSFKIICSMKKGCLYVWGFVWWFFIIIVRMR